MYFRTERPGKAACWSGALGSSLASDLFCPLAAEQMGTSGFGTDVSGGGLRPVPLLDASDFLLHCSVLAGVLITQSYGQTDFQKVQE